MIHFIPVIRKIESQADGAYIIVVRKALYLGSYGCDINPRINRGTAIIIVLPGIAKSVRTAETETSPIKS
jgi:hypothetical protein